MALETQDDYQDKIDDLMKEVEKLYDEGTDKGFKLKRSEEMNLEERKQEILANLEERAVYKSEKDYIKTVNSFNEKIKELQDEYDKYYSKSAVEKFIKQELESQERIIRNRYEREGLSLKNKIDYNKKLLENAHNEAKKQGFKVKRSEETDFEVRAKLRQQKDGETIGKNAVKIIDDCYEQAHAAKSKARNEGKTAIRAIEKVISDIRTLTKDGKDIDGDFDLTILRRYIESIENGIKAMDTI